MNQCQRQQETLSLLAAGLCPEPDRRPAEAHRQTCPACNAYFQELTALTGKISGLQQEHATAIPRPHLRARWTHEIMGTANASERGSVTRSTLQTRPTLELASASTCNQRVAARRAALRGSWLAWGLAAAACMLVALSIGHRHERTMPSDPLLNARLIHDTLAMFPHQLRAIVQDEHGLNLVLSDHANIPASAPLYIRICDGRHCSSFLTFSGQDITVAGQQVTVLADAHGGVILAGDHFLWSDSEKITGSGHWKIEAKNLGPVPM